MRLAPQPWWKDAKVRLFPLTVADVTDAYVGWLNDPAINRYLESRFVPQTRETVEAFVAGIEASANDLLLGIFDIGLGRHVGNIKLGPISRVHGLGEIGLMIGAREAWGRGIGSAAIARISEIGFRDLGLRKLSAGCYAANEGSARAFERAGFVREGVRPCHVLLDGKPEDVILLGRTADEEHSAKL